MRRPETDEYAPPYARYVDNVPEADVVAVLEAQTDELREFFEGIGEERAAHRYAADKWSIKEIAGHLGDGERIFGYRAHAVSRDEQQALPGWDENEYTPAGKFDRRTLADLVEELLLLRHANVLFFRSLDDAAWDKRGTASGYGITVRGLAYTIAGHTRHHMRVVKERYL